MFSLRRVALRVLSTPSPVLQRSAYPRSITTLTPSLLRQPPLASYALHLQRRLASDDASRKADELASDQTKHGEEESVTAALEAAQGEHSLNAESEQAALSADALATEQTRQGEDELLAPEIEKIEVASSLPAEGQSAESTMENVRHAAAHSATEASEFKNREQNPPRYDPSRGQREAPPLNPFHHPPRDQVPSNSCYVGNLFFDVTDDDLKREFSRFGTIKATRVIYDGKGLSKGFGYVDFESMESSKEAIENMNQQVFEGRRIVVQYRTPREPRERNAGRPDLANTREPREPSKTLFIGNMSFEMTDSDLNDLFGGISNVIDVRVAIDRRTGQPRGFAHADFVDIPSAEKAREFLRTKVIYGRMLRVDFGANSRGM